MDEEAENAKAQKKEKEDRNEKILDVLKQMMTPEKVEDKLSCPDERRLDVADFPSPQNVRFRVSFTPVVTSAFLGGFGRERFMSKLVKNIAEKQGTERSVVANYALLARCRSSLCDLS